MSATHSFVKNHPLTTHSVCTHKIFTTRVYFVTCLHAQQHSYDFFSLSYLEQKEIAINLYREGIGELERGINIDVWQGSGEKWTKAQRLHDKMQTNLAMAKDRLNFLGEL